MNIWLLRYLGYVLEDLYLPNFGHGLWSQLIMDVHPMQGQTLARIISQKIVITVLIYLSACCEPEVF